MTPYRKLAAAKSRLIVGLTALADEYTQLATDAEHFNTLPRATPPVDGEAYRVLAHAAREALRAVLDDRPIDRRWQEMLWPKVGVNHHAD